MRKLGHNVMKIGTKMASVISNALGVLIIISFRFSVIFGQCDRSSSYRDCAPDQVCSRRQCFNSSNCLYLSCSMDSDCSVNEVCCSGKCRSGSDCSGDFCRSSNDCSVGQKCCVNTCTNYDCEDPTVAILIAVVGSLVGLFVVFISIYYCHRRARLGRSGTAEVVRQVAPTDATTTQSANQQGYAYQQLP